MLKLGGLRFAHASSPPFPWPVGTPMLRCGRYALLERPLMPPSMLRGRPRISHLGHIFGKVYCFSESESSEGLSASFIRTTDTRQLKTCTSVIYCLGIMFVKLSLLLFYLQISPDCKFRLAVYGLAFIVASYSVASVLVVIFPCFPVAKSWDVTISGGYCINLPVFYLANLSLNSATDIAVLILPFPLLWSMRMPLRKKVAVTSIFMTGSA